MGWRASGLSPPSWKSASSGSSTGSSSSGTATSPHEGQCTIGIGAPQYRWRESSQSRSRKFTVASPRPSCSSQAATFAIEAGEGSPSNGPLSTITPSCGIASVIASGSIGSDPSGWITTRTGSPCCRANAKSRSSCAGTAMIAPVPYSISTYGAA